MALSCDEEQERHRKHQTPDLTALLLSADFFEHKLWGRSPQHQNHFINKRNRTSPESLLLSADCSTRRLVSPQTTERPTLDGRSNLQLTLLQNDRSIVFSTQKLTQNLNNLHRSSSIFILKPTRRSDNLPPKFQAVTRDDKLAHRREDAAAVPVPHLTNRATYGERQSKISRQSPRRLRTTTRPTSFSTKTTHVPAGVVSDRLSPAVAVGPSRALEKPLRTGRLSLGQLAAVDSAGSKSKRGIITPP
jgi:hypothetical protein